MSIYLTNGLVCRAWRRPYPEHESITGEDSYLSLLVQKWNKLRRRNCPKKCTPCSCQESIGHLKKYQVHCECSLIIEYAADVAWQKFLDVPNFVKTEEQGATEVRY